MSGSIGIECEREWIRDGSLYSEGLCTEGEGSPTPRYTRHKRWLRNGPRDVPRTKSGPVEEDKSKMTAKAAVKAKVGSRLRSTTKPEVHRYLLKEMTMSGRLRHGIRHTDPYSK